MTAQNPCPDSFVALRDRSVGAGGFIRRQEKLLTQPRYLCYAFQYKLAGRVVIVYKFKAKGKPNSI